MADILRAALDEYHVPHEGTAWSDSDTDDMYHLYQREKSVYFIGDENGELVGGCGVLAIQGLPKGYAELSRMYLNNSFRGNGYGKMLLQYCIDWAQDNGYTHLYLESFPSLTTAIKMYEKFGFYYLDKALGQSGHDSCNVWMALKL